MKKFSDHVLTIILYVLYPNQAVLSGEPKSIFSLTETFLPISFENMSSAASSAIWNFKWEDHLIPMMIL